jgi:hypothetical protein
MLAAVEPYVHLVGIINHRDRLPIRQVNPDTAPSRGSIPPASAPVACSAVGPPRHAATLTHRTSSLLRLGHQARAIAPGERPRINHTSTE